jgi:hypothetical protein
VVANPAEVRPGSSTRATPAPWVTAVSVSLPGLPCLPCLPGLLGLLLALAGGLGEQPARRGRGGQDRERPGPAP